MVELIKQQRHFLNLLVDTTVTQRKALLRTVTKKQLKVLAQIAYNILRFTIKLTSTEKSLLKRHRRFIYLLGNKKIGFQKKKEAIPGNLRTIYILVKIALVYLEPVLQ